MGAVVKIVLGIGNPGREYVGTRHNVGFRVVDRVAALLGIERGVSARKRRLKCLTGEGTVEVARRGRERVLLVKPETYVNCSGECARAVLDYFGAGVDSLLVVSDDVNLPLGRLRCRAGGSSGGHKGIESIIRHLGGGEFARLRVGVGPSPGEGPLTRHVLGRFASEERLIADGAEARAAEAALEWVRNGVESCMNLFNPKGREGSPR